MRTLREILSEMNKQLRTIGELQDKLSAIDPKNPLLEEVTLIPFGAEVSEYFTKRSPSGDFCEAFESYVGDLKLYLDNPSKR